MTTAIQIHHIGWAVRSIGAHHDHFARQIGLAYKGVEEFPTLKVAFFDAGGCLIELLEPTDASDDVAAFLERRGEGIHHIAYRVDDVADALRQAAAKGLRLLDREPRPGAHGSRIGFVDPGRQDGVLVEYVESPSMDPQQHRIPPAHPGDI